MPRRADSRNPRSSRADERPKRSRRGYRTEDEASGDDAASKAGAKGGPASKQNESANRKASKQNESADRKTGRDIAENLGAFSGQFFLKPGHDAHATTFPLPGIAEIKEK